jgi:hypothetical protein
MRNPSTIFVFWDCTCEDLILILSKQFLFPNKCLFVNFGARIFRLRKNSKSYFLYKFINKYVFEIQHTQTKKCFHKCLITTAGSWLNKLLAVLYLKEIGNRSLTKLGNHVKACFQQVEWLYRHYPPNSHRCLGNTSHNLHGN